MTPEQVIEVLAVFEEADDDGLMWRVQGDEPRLLAICSDTFWWATADCEEIFAADIPLLRQCSADLAAVDPVTGTCWLGSLFAARKRQMRPQQPCYKDMEAAVAVLFDACGPARDRASEG